MLTAVNCVRFASGPKLFTASPNRLSVVTLVNHCQTHGSVIGASYTSSDVKFKRSTVVSAPTGTPTTDAKFAAKLGSRSGHRFVTSPDAPTFTRIETLEFRPTSSV